MSEGATAPVPLISGLVVAHDEERQLAECLHSLSFADEIVVVLDRCTDRSREIALEFTHHIVEGVWEREGPRRHAGIDACRGQWILEVDADERVSLELAGEIRREISGSSAFDFYYVPFHNYIGKVWVRFGWGAYNGVAAKACLFRKGTKRWGEQEIHPRVVLSGRGGWLEGHMDHFVDEDISGVIGRLDRYSDAAARQAVAAGERLSVARTVRRCFSRFLKSYCQRRGYREGWRGVLLALFSGLYPVLTHIKALALREGGGRRV
jgi:glycosyltransferase involved in cell wall biosynthesis